MAPNARLLFIAYEFLQRFLFYVQPGLVPTCLISCFLPLLLVWCVVVRRRRPLVWSLSAILPPPCSSHDFLVRPSSSVFPAIFILLSAAVFRSYAPFLVTHIDIYA